MKILRRWDKYERWSMYDSDDIHYVEVEDVDGGRHVFKEIGRELTDMEIQKILDRINNPEEHHYEYAKREIAYWPDWKKKVYYVLLRNSLDGNLL